MLTIRLARFGKKKQPFYRVAVGEKKRSPNGLSIEYLGHLNPKTGETKLNQERIKYWLSQGASCSRTMGMLLVKEGLIDKEKLPKKYFTPRKRNKKKQAPVDSSAASPSTPAAPAEQPTPEQTSAQ